VNEIRLTTRRGLNWTRRIRSVFPGMPTRMANYKLHIINVVF